MAVDYLSDRKSPAIPRRIALWDYVLNFCWFVCSFFVFFGFGGVCCVCWFVFVVGCCGGCGGVVVGVVGGGFGLCFLCCRCLFFWRFFMRLIVSFMYSSVLLMVLSKGAFVLFGGTSVMSGGMRLL